MEAIWCPVAPADMLRSLSPNHKLDRITVPLFVLHSANDTNAPVVEAEQIVASHEARNVLEKFSLFPDEGHGWRKTQIRIRSTAEIIVLVLSQLYLPLIQCRLECFSCRRFQIWKQDG